MITKLLTVILITQTAIAFDFGNIVINDQKTKDDIELKGSVDNVLITSFLSAHILSAQKTNNSTAKITFARDQTGQNNYALVNQIENDRQIFHYSMVWLNPLPNEEFCVHIGGDQHWFSTYEEKNQSWPIDKNKTFDSPQAFSTHDCYQHLIGSIVEYLFLGSKGFGIYIERTAPLFLRRDSNNGNPLLCFSGDYHKSPYNHAIDTKETKITIHLLSGTDIMHVYRYAANKWIPKPDGIPDQRMIKYPIWSSWAKYHDDVNQEKVLDFAKQISLHGFPNSHIEIDETWEVKFGDFTFDTKKFPNATLMVSTLKSQGYRTTLWVTPFVNQNSEVVQKNSQYFIKGSNGSVLYYKWWNGMGAYVDFTNKEAQDWYVSRLENIRKTVGIDSFKFDAGELGYVNPEFQFSNRSVQQIPSLLSKLYAETISRLGSMLETRVGYNSQNVPVFIRMLDRVSDWSKHNVGLQTIIPTALMMSIAGYPYVLPDMIGGNAYGNFPSKELYIRWLQVNTFMPTLQISIAPWDFKESAQEVLNITKSMLKLHEEYTPLIISLAENCVKTGEPIMRPIWWSAPIDPNTFTIDDQFLVGNDLLVAPVVTDKTRKRDIYLPTGQWKDHRGVVHKGGQTLKAFSVELHELAYFVRQDSIESSSS